MESFIESVSGLISKAIACALVGGSIYLFAGEVRLAALKKASQGSVKLSGFTAKMTYERK